MHHSYTRLCLIFTCLSLFITFPVIGDDSNEPTSSETTESLGSNPENKLVDEFGEFLGGEESSREVITSLREGRYGQMEPTEPPSDGEASPSDESSSTGWGNVRITLKLAEARLAADGITQPTAEQLDAVLLGTDSDPNGILALRESGMGWGEISQQYGYKLGTLMGKGHQKTPVESTGVTSAANGTSTHAGGAKKNGYIPSGKQTGQGLTTASGGNAASLSSKSKGSGNAYGHSKITTSSASPAGKGLITAAGSSASHANAAAKGGTSNGKALGHSK